MDFTSDYCSERKHLERCAWELVSKLSVLTDRLMRLIGKDHGEFIVAKVNCTEVKLEVVEARDRLVAHRAVHGC